MTQSPAQHIKELLKTFDTAMLITHKGADGIHARPMQIVEKTDDGVVRFATSMKSPKIKEITKDEDVYLTFQGKSAYLALEGTADVEKDRATIDRVWDETLKVWFPKGKDDPDLCILTVTPKSAEFWDNSGMEGISYMFKAAKAYVSGTRPEIDKDIHGKAKL